MSLPQSRMAAATVPEKCTDSSQQQKQELVTELTLLILTLVSLLGGPVRSGKELHRLAVLLQVLLRHPHADSSALCKSNQAGELRTLSAIAPVKSFEPNSASKLVAMKRAAVALRALERRTLRRIVESMVGRVRVSRCVSVDVV